MNFEAIILIILGVYISFATGCPKDEDLYPCYCEWSGLEGRHYSSTTIYCEELHNDEDLVKAATAVIGLSYISAFSIKDSAFNFIPSNIFNGTKLPEINIVRTSLMGLTDTDVAFEGLEDNLGVLTMQDCNFMSEWEWSIFRNLRNLRKISIEKGDLESVEDLGKINLLNLQDISFDNNRISLIHSEAFSYCKHLKVLRLGHNKISEMKRSMIPNPALELSVIDLGYNKIEQLPDEMFTNMPSLKDINIAHNSILYLKEDIFKGTWSQLVFFDARGNDLRCDCRLEWILNNKSPNAYWGACALPLDLKGRKLQSLESKDLYCF